MKWYDNKCVHLASTFSGVNVTGSVKQWDSKTKNHKDVPLPDMVLNYNSSMGGADLAEKAPVFETDFPDGRHLQGQWLATLSSFL